MKEKTERLTVKLLPADKQALKQLADSEGESMAFVVRKLIRQAQEKRQVQALSFREAI